MAISVLDNGSIADDFVIGEIPYVYSDAIVMWPDQYNSYTKEQIEQMKKDRYDRWYQAVTNPPPPLPDVEEPPINEEV
jgi:hypothetical protein